MTGSELRDLRRRLRYSQHDVALLLLVGDRSVATWESSDAPRIDPLRLVIFDALVASARGRADALCARYGRLLLRVYTNGGHPAALSFLLADSLSATGAASLLATHANPATRPAP